MKLIIKFKIFAVFVFFIIFVKTRPSLAKCNLAKIFKTPRDFDHLEIVERGGFDHSESTTPSTLSTLPPSNKISKKNINNYANAHISVKFGNDGIGNHIMKVPPQFRHMAGNSHPLDPIPTNSFYYPPPNHCIPPPPHSLPLPPCQFYHPYPPPVPYIFPNFYYWSHRGEPTHLPPQLNDFFGRHPDCVVGRYPNYEEVFVDGKPVKKAEVIKLVLPSNLVDGKLLRAEKEDVLPVFPNEMAADEKPVNLIRSRILMALDSTDPTVESKTKENKETKRDCENTQKEQKKTKDAVGNNISMEFINHYECEICNQKEIDEVTEDSSELSTEESTEEFIDNLERILNDPLISYVAENCTGLPDLPDLLTSYPMIDKDSTLLQNQTKTELSPECTTSKQAKDENEGNTLRYLNTKDIVNSTCNCSCGIETSSENSSDTVVDDLISVLIEIIDAGPNSPAVPGQCYRNSSLLCPPIIPNPLSLYRPPPISPYIPIRRLSEIKPHPMSAIPNPDWNKYDLSNLHSSLNCPASCNCDLCECNGATPPATHVEHPNYSINEYKSIPSTVVVYHDCRNPSQLDFDHKICSIAPKVVYRYAMPEPRILAPKVEDRYAIPEPNIPVPKVYVAHENRLPEYINVVPANPLHPSTIITSTYGGHGLEQRYLPSIETIPAPILRRNIEPTTTYLVPKPNVIVKNGNNAHKYFEINPRSNFEPVAAEKSIVNSNIGGYSNIPDEIGKMEAVLCKKCGHRHLGGEEYCKKCGYPLIH